MTYTLTNLGPHQHYSYDPRFEGTTIYSVQDRATGGAFDTHAAYWDGQWTILPDPDDGLRRAVAEDGITDVVVGHIALNAPQLYQRAMIWTYSTGLWTPTALPLPTGALSSSAVAVSADGTKIAGEVDFGFYNIAAALWTESGGVWSVAVLPKPDLRAYTVGFDDATGDVIGNIVEFSNWHAVRWHYDGSDWTIVRFAFPGLVPPPPTEVTTTAQGHANGYTVGWSSVSGAPTQAVRWRPDGTIEDLGAGDHSMAYGTNGDVVVGTIKPGVFDNGFVWTATDGVVDIHPAGQDWSLPSGVDMNGRIVGTMGTGKPNAATGDRDFFLLTPSGP